MTEEKLKQARELADRIADFREHLKEFDEWIIKKMGHGIYATLSNNTDASRFDLKDEFIQAGTIMADYRAELVASIEMLESQFSKL